MKITATTAIVFVAVALAGCASTSPTPSASVSTWNDLNNNGSFDVGEGVGSGATTPSASAPLPTAASPSPVATATVSQYASAMAPSIQEAQESLDKFEKGLFERVCPLHLFGAKLTAMTVNINVSIAAKNSKADGYLGPPPAEISGLVDETQRTARAFIVSARAAGTKCTKVDPMATTSWHNALGKWAPYM